MYAVWIIWRIGLVFHTWSVFGFIFLFEKKWEARKISKYMNDQRESLWKLKVKIGGSNKQEKK
jgi:hypothetical protein